MLSRALKRQVLATLLKAGRRDLAGRALCYFVGADINALVGNTFWGKEAKLHFFASNVRLEQIPQGPRRGKQSTVMVLFAPKDLRRLEGKSLALLDRLAKEVPTASFKRLSGMLIQIHNVAKDEGHRTELDIRKQKAVQAPDPMQQTLPKPAANKHNVYIDMTGDAVSLQDNNDQNNLPSAFTQGPKAYKLALQTREDWQDLPYRAILNFWKGARIKYHSYMAMD